MADKISASCSNDSDQSQGERDFPGRKSSSSNPPSYTPFHSGLPVRAAQQEQSHHQGHSFLQSPPSGQTYAPDASQRLVFPQHHRAQYPASPSRFGTSSGSPPPYTSFEASSSDRAFQQQWASHREHVSRHHSLPGKAQSPNAQQPGISHQNPPAPNSDVQISTETPDVQHAIAKLKK